jgi:membrane associated rhomboid family serine protease
MLRCPNCGTRLARARSPFGVVYYCSGCKGRMAGLATLRRDAVAKNFRAQLWQASAYASAGDKCCPHCYQFMRRVDLPAGGGMLELDVCRHCQCIWFDTAEYGRMPRGPAEPVAAGRPERPDRPSDPRAREAAALFELQRVRRRQEQEDTGPKVPAEPWKWLVGLMGLPVEMSQPVLSSVPVVTWTLGAVMVLVFLGTWSALEGWIRALGFIPEQWARAGGATLVTSFFMHGGLLHLIGNLYFFLIFGDNVEDRLGRGRFLLLVLGSHLAGTLAHAALDQRGDMPLVGASAGIFGVVAFYALSFPHSRIGLLFFYLWWIRLPAWMLLVFYGVIQALGTLTQVGGETNISHLGHVGGMAVGIVAALLWRARSSGAGAAPRRSRDPQASRDERGEAAPPTRGYSKSERRDW